MLSRLAQKWSMAARAQAPSVPDGVRIYAIGDIHGCKDLLDQLLAAIQSDLTIAPVERAVCVLLGDYVDRGPDSAGVLAMLGLGELPLHLVALRGNHEAMLLTFLRDPTFLDEWRHYGGLETLHSFGIDIEKARRPDSFAAVREQLAAALPQPVLRFLDEAPNCYEIGDYYFCHAGVRPDVALAQQRAEDLLTIRSEFLDSRRDWGKIIVHGHTPVQRPDVRPNRINIDTGAYITGTLTCLVLERETRRFLST